jgi:hypothetical protein
MNEIRYTDEKTFSIVIDSYPSPTLTNHHRDWSASGREGNCSTKIISDYIAF